MKKQIKRKIYLLSKKQPMKPIEVIQYETGIQLIFEVQDIDLDTTATATMFIRKPSGKFVFQEDNIFLTGNTVTVDLHNQALAEYGHPFFQIKFKKDEEVISTYSGMLSVDKSLEDSGAEESKTVIAAFDTFTDEQIARIEEATQTQIDLMKAEVEAKGLSVLSTIPDDYTEMFNRLNALYNSVANAIKGFVSGSVVRVDDVSPVEHNPVVKVHGKNLIDLSKIEVQVSDNIYISAVGEGYIEITTADGYVSNGHRQTYVKLKNLCPQMVENRSYVLNAETESTLKMAHLRDVDMFVDFGKPFVATKEMLESYLAFYGFDTRSDTSGGTCRISNIQLELGSTATEYTPYIDPTTVTVTRCGKNLVSYPYRYGNMQNNGVEFTVFDNGVIGMKGTSADYAVFYADNEGIEFEGGVSYDIVQPSTKKAGLVLNYTDENGKSAWVSSTIVWKSGYKYIGLYIQIDPGVTIDENFVPIVKRTIDPLDSYTPATDGSCDIISVSPTMTLLTDKEGVTIECEYNKDTGKVIEKLTNAVVALGGVV